MMPLWRRRRKDDIIKMRKVRSERDKSGSCAALIMTGLLIYGKSQMAKVPGLTFKEALEYTTHEKKDAVITVGIIQNRKASWKVYGENGQELRLWFCLTCRQATGFPQQYLVSKSCRNRIGEKASGLILFSLLCVYFAENRFVRRIIL